MGPALGSGTIGRRLGERRYENHVLGLMLHSTSHTLAPNSAPINWFSLDGAAGANNTLPQGRVMTTTALCTSSLSPISAGFH